VALGRDAGTFAILLLNDALALNEPVPDAVPITRLLFFVAPSPRAHLELLGLLSSALLRGGLRDPVVNGADDPAIFAALIAAETNAARPKEGPQA
jgi:PTS system nitrogen regulatory IIA component